MYMKMFLLVVTILLLLLTIKSTPRSLSKTKYDQNSKKIWEELLEKINNVEVVNTKDYFNAVKFVYLVFGFIVELLLVLYYCKINSYFNTTFFLVMSAIQVVTSVISFVALNRSVNKMELDADYEDVFPFHRWYLLFNLILDYVYCLAVLYMMLFYVN